MNKLTTLILVTVLISTRLSGQTTIDVTENIFKIGMHSEEVFYYGFAEGDQVIFNFEEVSGKELKELEIIEYPSSTKFMDYKTKKVENKILNITKNSIYKFRLYNSAISGRICKMKIQRIPNSDATKNFNSSVTWVKKQDTTWNTYTKDIIIGYDTSYFQKIVKELIKIDTTVTQLFDKTERVFSGTAIGKNQYSNINVNLPENYFAPNKSNCYKSQEVISWSYWLGVGQKAKEEYEKANSISKGISAIGALTGYGALASLAVTGISMFGTTLVGDNVKYEFITVYNGQKDIFDFGNGIAAKGRNDKLLQGGFTIELFNDNLIGGIDVIIKVIAVQITKYWEDIKYTEKKVTPRYGKKIFKAPIITTIKVPICGQ